MNFIESPTQENSNETQPNTVLFDPSKKLNVINVSPVKNPKMPYFKSPSTVTLESSLKRQLPHNIPPNKSTSPTQKQI